MTQLPTYKQLRRSRTDRMLGGVCGGLAHYFGVDPVAVRVGYAVVTLLSGGLAVLAYLALWLLMPENPAEAPWAPAQPWTTPSGPSDHPAA